MEEIRYPKEDVYQGPFLIDSERMRELDKLLDQECQKLENWHGKMVQEEADKRIADPSRTWCTESNRDEVVEGVLKEYDWRVAKREVKATLKGGKEATAQRFEELAVRPDLRDLVPVGFSVVLQKGTVEVEIEPSHTGLSAAYSVVANSHTGIAQEVKGALGRWLADASPKWWIRFWSRVTSFFPVHWAVVFVLVYALILVWGASDSPRDIALRSYQSQLRQETTALLQDGQISQSEIPDALRIDLEFASGYLPPTTELTSRVVPKGFLIAIVIAVIVALLLSLRPRFELAVGRGASRIKVWSIWLHFLGVTLPAVAFFYLLLPLISQWLWG